MHAYPKCSDSTSCKQPTKLIFHFPVISSLTRHIYRLRLIKDSNMKNLINSNFVSLIPKLSIEKSDFVYTHDDKISIIRR